MLASTVLLLAAVVPQYTVVLRASDSTSIIPGRSELDTRALVTAEYEPRLGFRRDGLIKFDMTSVPDVDHVLSVHLTVWTWSGPGYRRPWIQLFHYEDYWHSGWANPHLGEKSALTLPMPVGLRAGLVPVTVRLDLGDWDWEGDLHDGSLSILVRNLGTPSGAWSVANWCGARTGAFAPLLEIEV